MKKSKRKIRNCQQARVEQLENRTLLSAWFVSTSGSDAAAGTIDAPLASIKSAVAKASAGDTINLRGGTHSLSSTLYIDTSDLTIQAYNGEDARIVAPTTNSSIANAVDIGASNNIKLLNLDISGGYHYTVKADGGDNLLISGSKLHDSGADVVKLAPGTDYSVIESSEIYNSGRRDGSNAEGVDAVGADYATLRDSYIHHIATNGVYYKGGSVGTVIERNRVTATGYSGILLGQSTDAEFFDASNPEHYESIDGIVRNNVVWDVTGAGIGAWAALRPQIYNNTLHNVAKSLFGGLLVQAEAGRASTDVTLQNNIVVVNSSRPVLTIRADGLTGSLVSDYNYFHNSNGSPQVWDDTSGYYGGVSGWQSRGYDTHSVTGDPGVDAGNGYHLTATSGAINRGVSISSVTDDMDGQSRPAGGAYEIGADEVSSTSTPTEPAPTEPTPTEPAPTEPAPTEPVPTEPAPSEPVVTYTPSWDNAAFAAQRGVFTVEFDATPAMNNMEMIMGLSQRSTTSVKDLGPIARFNANGTIDVRTGNGESYRADAQVAYTAGETYHFRYVVDLSRRTYDLFVTSSGTTTQIANDYSFRARGNPSQFANLATFNRTGDATVTTPTAAPLFA